MEEAVDQARRRPRRGSTSLRRSPTLLRPLNYQSFDAERQFIHRTLGSFLEKLGWHLKFWISSEQGGWVLLFLYSVYGSSCYVYPYAKMAWYYFWNLSSGKIGKCADSGMAHRFQVNPHEISDLSSSHSRQYFPSHWRNTFAKESFAHEPYRYYAWLVRARWAYQK